MVYYENAMDKVSSREERGRQLAAKYDLKPTGKEWVVPSASSTKYYIVLEDEGSLSCNCPDYKKWQEPCKHIFAVYYTIEGLAGNASTTPLKKPTYRQVWPAYNEAQVFEKERVAELLRELCAPIPTPPQKRGRPRLPWCDLVFSAVMKVYGTTSARRAMTDIRGFQDKGLIEKSPHYNSIFNILEDPALTPILKQLIEESSLPLKAVESDFSADSSGFSVATHIRWFDAKYGRQMDHKKWIKAHIMVGVKTNIVTSIEITPADVHDSPVFPDLLESTSKRFSIKRLSADKGYLSDRNFSDIVQTGAVPFIPFKSNTTGEGSPLWREMYHYYMFRREEFLRYYHQRSNVETTFSMIKKKFGDSLRSKTDTAQINELLCKILCHNLCVLVQSIYELGIEPAFWKEAA